ncbi:ribokinase [Nitrospira sp.]|nr:ribokinase [Nitrospira sp.]
MPKVFVIGSSNIDLTVRLDRLPHPGETVSGGEFYQSFGGKGANQAVAARRSGADVVFVTKLGTDENGDRLAQHLIGEGLPAYGILRDRRETTGVALIVVDGHGRNQIAVAPGSNRLITPGDILPYASVFEDAQVLLVQLEVPIPAVTQALTLAKASGVITMLNPAPAQPLSDAVLGLVNVLTPNETEIVTLTGETDSLAGARALLRRGVETVVVTLGEHGVLCVNKEGERRYSAFSVQAVDTTGAGDAFNGALGSALATGWSLEESIRFASAAGALATTKRGAQSSLPTRSEIDQFLDRYSAAT